MGIEVYSVKDRIAIDSKISVNSFKKAGGLRSSDVRVHEAAFRRILVGEFRERILEYKYKYQKEEVLKEEIVVGSGFFSKNAYYANVDAEHGNIAFKGRAGCFVFCIMMKEITSRGDSFSGYVRHSLGDSKVYKEIMPLALIIPDIGMGYVLDFPAFIESKKHIEVFGGAKDLRDVRGMSENISIKIKRALDMGEIDFRVRNSIVKDRGERVDFDNAFFNRK